MYRLALCLTQDHDFALMAAAALLCVVGSALTVHLCDRLLEWRGARKLVQLALGATIAGSTIWSTHFLAMLAYDPGFPHSYEPVLTGTSLLIAVLGCLISLGILGYGSRAHAPLLAGAVFGLVVSAMHFTGMKAYLLPGTLDWLPANTAASVGFGVVLGAVSHRMIAARPRGLGPRALTTGCFVLSICAMHFIAMSAFDVHLDSAIAVPANAIGEPVLAMLVAGVTAIILLIGIASAGIGLNIENQARDALDHAALHDPLTGLPNRVCLTTWIAGLRRDLQDDRTARAAVLTIDLTQFKEINDQHGHDAGDTVLQIISARMQAQCGPDERVARIGGDEFAALKTGFRRIDEVTAFAERLHAAITDTVELETAAIRLAAKIGMATSLGEGRDPDVLLHKSSRAMDRARSDPDLHICLFSAEMDRLSRAKLQLVQDMRKAIGKNQFDLFYQLQNDVRTLEPVGFEVLLRWTHPERGPVPPSDFIPLAEETGMIRDIGHWVLKTACLEAAQWRVPYPIAVNVAPQQLVQPSFIENTLDVLWESGLAPDRLELEITEASMIDDEAHTLKVMHKLKSIGIRIAMDDFGTGYSSLAMLQTFPFDKIKIDRSFVQDVHKNAQRAAIVRATLLLGAALDIPVLAEGVETEDELAFLRAEHCASAQGYFFGRPLRREDMLRLTNADPDRRPVAG